MRQEVLQRNLEILKQKKVLENCISEKLIPNKKNWQESPFGPKYANINEANTTASFEWMKVALKTIPSMKRKLLIN